MLKMFTCRVFNIFSNNSSYVVEFNTRREVSEFVERKEADEYVDRVEVKKPSFFQVVWHFFDAYRKDLYPDP